MHKAKRENYLPFGRPDFSQKEIDAVTRVLKSGWVGMGAEVIAFEKELAHAVDASYALAVNSCTSALHLSLLAHGIKEGDEVICPSLTWISSVNTVIYAGATPVFCDVDMNTMNASAETIKAVLSPKTKAVILVHYGGLAIDVDEIRAILPDDVVIIEDAAHALGAKYSNGEPVGSSGNLTCFSFYANKNLSTGDGGAIVCNDENMHKKLTTLSRQGLNSNAWKRYTSPEDAFVPLVCDLGYKMNYTDLLASIARVQLERQDEFYDTRIKIAQKYYEVLSEQNLGIEFQVELINPYHARHLFVVKLPVEKMSITRNELLLKLRQLNVGVSIHYKPVHQMPLFDEYNVENCENVDNLFSRIMTLPISASMSLDDVDYVIENFVRELKECLKDD